MDEQTINTMGQFRRELSNVLDEAYKQHDLCGLSGDVIEQTKVDTHLDTIKQIGEMVGLRSMKRRLCKGSSCSIHMPRGSFNKYCSNACRQKAYRRRHGQMKI